MESRPVIGITSHLEPARWGDCVREAVVSPASYARAVHRAGGLPVVLPPVPGSGAQDLAAKLGGLIVSAGGDVDPRLYGEHPHTRTADPDSRRDRFESAIARAAIEAGLPFLAISRGMQVLNVALGGSLIQHVPAAIGHDLHAPGPGHTARHGIRISAEAKLGAILGTTAEVTGAHHQAVQRLGTRLVAVAWSDDQIVEAVELQGHPFGIGVQWRPEDGDDLRIFEALVGAAERQRATHPVQSFNGDRRAVTAQVGRAAAHARRGWRR